MNIIFVRLYILVGPDTNWVCTITVVRGPDSGTDIKNRGNIIIVFDMHNMEINEGIICLMETSCNGCSIWQLGWS